MGSIPVRVIKNTPNLRIGSIFYATRSRNRTARLPAGSKKQPSGLFFSARVRENQECLRGETILCYCVLIGSFFMQPVRGIEQHGRPQAATDSPVGCLFVRGSKRIRNVSRARLLLIPVRGIEQHGRPQTATDSPVGCLFVRGSERIRNVCGARLFLCYCVLFALWM